MPDSKVQTPFDRFKEITSKIISVPKKEIDKREKAWKKKRHTKASA